MNKHPPPVASFMGEVLPISPSVKDDMQNNLDTANKFKGQTIDNYTLTLRQFGQQPVELLLLIAREWGAVCVVFAYSPCERLDFFQVLQFLPTS